jgi:hypothetical protein
LRQYFLKVGCAKYNASPAPFSSRGMGLCVCQHFSRNAAAVNSQGRKALVQWWLAIRKPQRGDSRMASALPPRWGLRFA